MNSLVTEQVEAVEVGRFGPDARERRLLQDYCFQARIYTGKHGNGRLLVAILDIVDAERNFLQAACGVPIIPTS